MIKFTQFQRIFLQKVYSKTEIPKRIIEKLYEHFQVAIEYTNTIAIDSFKENNLDYNEFIQSDDYVNILNDVLDQFIHDQLKNKHLTQDGFCLKSNLLRRACCLISNKNIVGIVVGIDEKNPRFLIVDFGEKNSNGMKIDIDELIIG